MNRNKKVVESMTVASALLVMTTITALGGSTEDGKGNVTGNVLPSKNGTAGIVSELYDMELVPQDKMKLASVEKVQHDTVSEGSVIAEDSQEVLAAGIACGAANLTEFVAEEVVNNVGEDGQIYMAANDIPSEAGVQETADTQASDVQEAETGSAQEAEVPEETVLQPQETIIEEAAAEAPAEAAQEAAPEGTWTNMVMANVEEDMNIRTAPDADSELAGKFYRGDVAEVISVEGEWTKISSGNATGYVKNEYLVYGEEANQLANEVCSLYATVNTDGLRLRSEPHEEAGIVTTASDGEKLKVNKEAEGTDGWVAVYTTDSTAYVSAEYVNVELNLGTALNSEEVAAKEAQEAEAQQAAESSSKKPAASANSDEVTLLGALIQCEAGGGSYEGMVAVGAVVMNRVRSGSYPGSISGVIYQGGQFTPALNGSVSSVMAGGVRSACLQAAREAIGGVDNTNGALSFRSAASGHSGTVIGANVFF